MAWFCQLSGTPRMSLVAYPICSSIVLDLLQFLEPQDGGALLSWKKEAGEHCDPSKFGNHWLYPLTMREIPTQVQFSALWCYPVNSRALRTCHGGILMSPAGILRNHYVVQCLRWTKQALTFLDFGTRGNGTAIGGWSQAKGRYLKLGWGEHIVGATWRVSEDGPAEALPATLSSVAVYCSLQLVEVAQTSLLTLIRV